MAVRASTGYAAAILGPTSFDDLMNDGYIEIRSGAQPDLADYAPTGAVLGRITRDGGVWAFGGTDNGLRFFRDGRSVRKETSHEWKLMGSATGTAGWFRWYPYADDNHLDSTEHVRIDGKVGLLADVGDIQLYLPSLALTNATDLVIDDWYFALPPLGV